MKYIITRTDGKYLTTGLYATPIWGGLGKAYIFDSLKHAHIALAGIGNRGIFIEEIREDHV